MSSAFSGLPGCWARVSGTGLRRPLEIPSKEIARTSMPSQRMVAGSFPADGAGWLLACVAGTPLTGVGLSGIACVGEFGGGFCAPATHILDPTKETRTQTSNRLAADSPL